MPTMFAHGSDEGAADDDVVVVEVVVDAVVDVSPMDSDAPDKRKA